MKRDGSLVPRDISKIRECVKRACAGLKHVDVELIVQEAVSQLFDGISTFDIDKATVLAARSQVIYEPEYSYAAASLLLNGIYKEVFGEHVNQRWFTKQYREVFERNLKALIEAGRIDGKVVEKFDLKKLADSLKPERDNLFKYLGIQTVYDRYLIHIDKRRMETPQAFWMRVCMGITQNEDNPTERAIEAYEKISTFRYCPSTPTLFNSCTIHPQMSSCYLTSVGDSIDQIYGGIHDLARLSKYAGGLGTSWSGVRGMYSYIKGTNGEGQGIIPWLKCENDMLVAVNQGGLRKGAGAAYLAPWHVDFPDFLEARKNTGDDRRRTHDLHTVSWIPDEFMKRTRNNDDWYMFSPDECPLLHELSGGEFSAEYARCIEATKTGEVKNFSVTKAKEVWRKMLTALLETGHPWVTFSCPSNLRYSNRHVGVVHSSNLCVEIQLHTKPSLYNQHGVKIVDEALLGETAVCNLGSLNLHAHVKNGSIDWDLLSETIHSSIRLLDNVIDVNFYPTPESRKANMNNRPIGLGMMAWHDTLHEMGIAFDSEEAIRLRSKVAEFISHHAIIASSNLAAERGCYPNYDGSTWSKGKMPVDTYNDLMEHRGSSRRASPEWKELAQQARDCVADNGMRNSNTMAVAPTATISFIVGCSQSIEPDFSTLFSQKTLSGDFTMISEHFVNRMKELGLWSKEFANEVLRRDGDVSELDIPDDVKQQFKTAFQVDQLKLIEATAAAQVWIDMGQSMNLYANTKSLKLLSEMYFHAWEFGLKTTYYLHGTAASKVEKATVSSEPKMCSINNPDCESCQ